MLLQDFFEPNPVLCFQYESVLQENISGQFIWTDLASNRCINSKLIICVLFQFSTSLFTAISKTFFFCRFTNIYLATKLNFYHLFCSQILLLLEKYTSLSTWRK